MISKLYSVEAERFAADCDLQAVETLRGIYLSREIILQDLLVASLEEGKSRTCLTKDEQAHLDGWNYSSSL
jgi:hypothetical protein